MTMLAETSSLADSILIDDSERAKVLEFRILVRSKREGVKRIEPPVVRMASRVPRSLGDFQAGCAIGAVR